MDNVDARSSYHDTRNFQRRCPKGLTAFNSCLIKIEDDEKQVILIAPSFSVLSDKERKKFSGYEEAKLLVTDLVADTKPMLSIPVLASKLEVEITQPQSGTAVHCL